LVERSQLILLLIEGEPNSPAARKQGLHVDTVRAWRARWLEAEADLANLESVAQIQALTDPNLKVEKVVLARLQELLSDLPRPVRLPPLRLSISP